MSRFDPIALEILWSRLVAIVDEAAATMVRTSFSTVVREANDFACVLMDRHGSSLAQSTLSIPSFIGTLPITTRHFLKRFPAESLRPGDVIITNDPWLATGHLPDITVAVPIFRQGRLIAFAGTIAHSPDIGGRTRAGDCREVYEEGLRIPICKLYRAGAPNQDVVTLIRSNVRVPDEVMGDLHAQIAANAATANRLQELLDEHDLDDVDEVAEAIKGATERAMRSALLDLPDGDYDYELGADGFDFPLVIRCRVTLRGDAIRVDYQGTSPQVDRAINVVHNYTLAYSAFAVKCIVSPEIPNNDGALRPLEVVAPPGCLVNTQFPAPVGGRVVSGHFLPAAIFGALARLIPDRVQAPSGSPLWGCTMSGVNERNERFASVFFLNGGQGASSRQDGISALAFPSNISNSPVEVMEAVTPVLVRKKELRPDTGGTGTHRGGCGQSFELEITSPAPVVASVIAERVHTPAPGLAGGRSGITGTVRVNGCDVHPKTQRLLQPGDVLLLETPGGGGFGDPGARDRRAILEDLSDGFVTAQLADLEYRLRVD